MKLWLLLLTVASSSSYGCDSGTGESWSSKLSDAGISFSLSERVTDDPNNYDIDEDKPMKLLSQFDVPDLYQRSLTGIIISYTNIARTPAIQIEENAKHLEDKLHKSLYCAFAHRPSNRNLSQDIAILKASIADSTEKEKSLMAFESRKNRTFPNINVCDIEQIDPA